MVFLDGVVALKGIIQHPSGLLTLHCGIVHVLTENRCPSMPLEFPILFKLLRLVRKRPIVLITHVSIPGTGAFRTGVLTGEQSTYP